MALLEKYFPYDPKRNGFGLKRPHSQIVYRVYGILKLLWSRIFKVELMYF